MSLSYNQQFPPRVWSSRLRNWLGLIWDQTVSGSIQQEGSSLQYPQMGSLGCPPPAKARQLGHRQLVDNLHPHISVDFSRTLWGKLPRGVAWDTVS